MTIEHLSVLNLLKVQFQWVIKSASMKFLKNMVFPNMCWREVKHDYLSTTSFRTIIIRIFNFFFKLIQIDLDCKHCIVKCVSSSIQNYEILLKKSKHWQIQSAVNEKKKILKKKLSFIAPVHFSYLQSTS